jgi:hypothetical protein
MRTIALSVLILSLALAMPHGAVFAQYAATTIENITLNPAKYSDAAVEVVGLVTIYAPAASSSTSHYLLKSENGTVIRVNTTEGAPDLNRKYRVTGIVYIDPVTKLPFISEKTRSRTDQPPPAETPAVNAQGSWLEDYWWIVALLVVLFGVVIYLQTRTKRATPAKPQPAEELTAAELSPPPPPGPAAPSDLKTIRIMPPAPKTMRYMPGELVLATGEDKGKSFKFAGFPTPEGSIVTIGREPVTGERAYAHIQIDEKFHTVSRKQAELIWKDKKLYVKNLSETNPTQVNGVELKAGKVVQLKPGSIIRTGELEFQYNA